MKKTHFSVIVLFIFVLTGTSCSVPGPTVLQSGGGTGTPAILPTETQAPSKTTSLLASSTSTVEPTLLVTKEPSPTATITIHELEIEEWSVFPYANLVDPNNTDKRVEILIHNPNEFPVRVKTDEVELRFLNAAGEIVYTNPNPTFYLWEGSWIREGETAAISACVCFDTDDVPKQEWDSLTLIAPLEEATGIAFTTDVVVSLGEFFSLAEAHLGGDQLGAEINLVNTGSEVLQSFEVRVIARDANHKYVGVAVHGTFSDSDGSGGYLDIQPGASANGIVVTEIDYVKDPLTYEVSSIGIPANH